MEFLKKHSTATNPALRIVVLMLLIVLPIIGFVIGAQYQSLVNVSSTENNIVDTPLLENPSKNNTISNISDQVTYENSKYGFSFQYPAAWNVRKDAQSFKESKDVFTIWIWGLTQKEGTELYDGSAFAIGEPINSSQDIKQWVRSYYGEKSEITGKVYVYNTTTINGRVYETMSACGQECFTYYHFRSGDYIYRIMTTANGPNADSYKKEINNMLMSIKIL